MTLAAMMFVFLSALIDIVANMLIVKSKSFQRLGWGVMAILLVWLAFWLLGQAVKTMDIAVAYAIWGAIGIMGTAACGRWLFGHRLRPLGWLGIVLVTLAVILLASA